MQDIEHHIILFNLFYHKTPSTFMISLKWYVYILNLDKTIKIHLKSYLVYKLLLKTFEHDYISTQLIFEFSQGNVFIRVTVVI